MNLAILGPPGSGKGTQASRVSKKLGVVHISTGEILREAVRKNSALGNQAKKYLDAGQLVPDGIMMEIVKARVNQPDCADGFILDGFPRTIPQAKMLDQLGLPSRTANFFLDRTISLEISEEECVRRLADRRNCPQCGLTYNPATHPPKKKEQCDRCGAALVLRGDDQPATVRERLKVYHQLTEPLIDYYKQSQRLIAVNATSTPEIVFQNLINML